MPNPVGHFEICVKDMGRGIEFYRDLFDWDIRIDPDMNYGIVSTGKSPGGGIFPLEGEMRPYITVYIEVEDIDGTLDKAAEKGAHVIQRKKKISEEHGYYGMFADRDGNIIGLWSNT